MGENFELFLNNLGFEMNENGFPIPRHLADQEIQYFIRELRNPTQHERNLFILYQLFTLTRRLVQMFVYTGFAGSYLDLFTQSEYDCFQIIKELLELRTYYFVPYRISCRNTDKN